MFSAIAPSYDLNNRLHSMGQDQAWRKKSVRHANVKPTDVVLDVACGTGDLSMAFARAGAQRVIGMDFTHDMVTIAQTKRPPPPPPPTSPHISPALLNGEGGSSTSSPAQRSATHPTTLHYQTADAMRLPLPDASVDVVSIAFGIRNVADPQVALQEFARVLRPGGRLIILEFSLPTNRILRGLFNFYFNHIMSRTCAWIARDRSGAYRYLARSVNTFMGRDEMVQRITDTGLTDVTTKPLTFGIAVIYRGIKSSTPH